VRLLLVVVLSVPLARSAGAQVVSEQEFLAGITERHPALAVTSQPLVEAQAALQRARVLSNPVVEAIREDPQEVARQTTLTLSWVPPFDGRRRMGIRAAEAGVAAAEKQVAAAQLHLQLEAKAAYAEWAAASALHRVLAEEARGMVELARRVRARAEAGEESALAAGRLDLAAADVQAELRSAAADELLTGAVARAWRPDLPAAAVPELPEVSPPRDQAAPLVLEALERETERARLQERLAGRFWTFPALQAGWQRQHHDEASGPVFGLSWTIPLFDRNQGGRQEAQRRREMAEARMAWATARVAAAVDGRRGALKVLRDAMQEAERAATLAPPVVRAATARFEAGEATVTELVEAIAAARSAQRRAVEARARALAAERALIGTTAGLTEGELR
jgi:cobalt-zinc-cadmium efflux system outer membrane protein